MSQVIKLSKHQKMMFLIVLSVVVVAWLVPWKAKAQSQGNIHIVYKSSISRPALSKALIDEQLAAMHNDFLSQRKHITGKQLEVLDMQENALRMDLQSRYKSQTYSLRDDYWGDSIKMLWVYNQNSIPDPNSGSFVFYNGKYIAHGGPGGFLASVQSKEAWVPYYY